jgi:acetylornithine deacetylase/succinyl-diaminopimelate desuccinylase-like protein
MNRIIFYIVLILLKSEISYSQKKDKIDSIAFETIQENWNDFFKMLSIPNDGYDTKNIYKNIDWCEKTFSDLGFTFEKVSANTNNEEIPNHPLLIGNKIISKTLKTVLIYFHMDGQPVDPSKWNQENPYIPVLKEKVEGNWEEIDIQKINNSPNREWRIFGRSTSDDKGPPMMLINALKIIKKLNLEPKFNIKLIIDFQEEMSSPTIASAVQLYKEKLKSDFLLIIDGPQHPSNEPTLTFGARGISKITLTAYGPINPQHSGHFGNYAPNPAFTLSKILSSMKDYSGRVLIPGFYDGIKIGENTIKILQAVPDDENQIKKQLGIAFPDNVGNNYQESIQYPSLNIRGLSSGWVRKEVRTIVPDNAIAEIDIRLVKESNPEKLIGLVKNHIINEGAYVIENRDPTIEERNTKKHIIRFDSSISYLAFRTEINSPIGNWASSALKKAFGREPVKIRTSGGSIPISPFVSTLNVPALTYPSVNKDNNQHSPNENIKIGNFIDGVLGMTYLLLEEIN